MPHSFKLIVGVNKDAVEELPVEISDDDWGRLRSYLEDFDLLAATRMGGHCQIKVRFTFDAQAGWSYDADLPPEDDIAAFLHRLRPFLLNDEQSNFNRVCNILGRAIRHRGITALLRKQRAEFSGEAFRSQMQLQSNGTVVNTESVLQKWLNGYEYHRDPTLREELRQIHTPDLALDATRPLFVSMMIDKAKAIAEVAQVVRLIMLGEKGRSVRFGRLAIKPQGS